MVNARVGERSLTRTQTIHASPQLHGATSPTCGMKDGCSSCVMPDAMVWHSESSTRRASRLSTLTMSAKWMSRMRSTASSMLTTAFRTRSDRSWMDCDSAGSTIFITG